MLHTAAYRLSAHVSDILCMYVGISLLHLISARFIQRFPPPVLIHLIFNISTSSPLHLSLFFLKYIFIPLLIYSPIFVPTIQPRFSWKTTCFFSPSHPFLVILSEFVFLILDGSQRTCNSIYILLCYIVRGKDARQRFVLLPFMPIKLFLIWFARDRGRKRCKEREKRDPR